MKITSDDCKAFLVKHFKQNQKEQAQWKRTAKYNVGSETYRDFTHISVGEVIVRDTPLLIVGINMQKPAASVNSYDEDEDNQDYIAAQVSWLYDATGSALVDGDPSSTMCDCEDIDPDSLILCGTEQGEDDDGTKADIYFFEDEDTGRNYSLFVYEDGSWAYESD